MGYIDVQVRASMYMLLNRVFCFEVRRMESFHQVVGHLIEFRPVSIVGQAVLSDQPEVCSEVSHVLVGALR